MKKTLVTHIRKILFAICLVSEVGYAEEYDPFAPTEEELAMVKAMTQALRYEVINWAQGDENEQEKVYEMARQYDDYRCDQAIYELGRFNTPRAADTLYEIAKTARGVTAMTAIKTLETMSAELAVPRLIALLQELPLEDQYGYISVMGGLKKFPGEETEQALLNCINANIDGNRKVLASAISALGSIGTEKSLEKLDEILTTNSDQNAKGLAKIAKKRIEARLKGNPDPFPDLDIKVEVITNGSPGIILATSAEDDAP